MQRITISVDTKMLGTLEKIAKKQNITLARAARESIKNGLPFTEDPSLARSGGTDKTTRKFLERNLLFSREILTITRFLLNQIPEKNKGQNSKNLQEVRAAAEEFLKEFLNE